MVQGLSNEIKYVKIGRLKPDIHDSSIGFFTKYQVKVIKNSSFFEVSRT
jgi:hypothetical protein